MFSQNTVLTAIESRAMVKEIVSVDPEIKHILLELATLPPNPDMGRWQMYEDLKRIFYHYVGWGARKEEIATSHHYAAFVTFLDAILPEDKYPEEIEEITA